MTINKKTITVVKNSENKIISDSETKDDSEGNNDAANGHDSDNELDYNYDEAIDNSQPLKDEKGRDKIQSSKPLPMFKKLFTSEVCSALKRFGGSPAPLSLIGTFLSYVGNYVLQHIHEKYKKRVFYPFWEVLGIRHLPTGELITTAEINGIKVIFKSRAIVMATGGKPSIPREISNSVSQDKLITADSFLGRKGFEAFIETLNKNFSKRKIVIIGGSHSGFSWAWVLLNGPAWFNHNKNGWGLTFESPPGAKTFICKNETDWGSHLLDWQSKLDVKEVPKICHCYGSFSEDDLWKYERPKTFPQFGNSQITIVYKERIKVFYSKVSKAAADGYTDYQAKWFRNKNGYLYSFTGLRGDARRLYQDVVKGKEKRIRLVQAETWQEQQKYVDSADYVILACGYQTNKIPIKTSEGKDIKLEAKVPGTQFDIDAKFRIKMTDGGSINKIYGWGLAFPTRTNDGRLLPEKGVVNPRADSFSLYLNYVGTKILDSLLPKSKLSNKVMFVYSDKALQKRRQDEINVKQKLNELNKLTPNDIKNSKSGISTIPRNHISRSKNNRGLKMLKKSEISK